jgi:putative ABC transport system permease protein
MKWLLFAWKNVFRNKRRTVITLLLAAIGTAGVLMASGFALYTYDSLKQMSARQIGHVVMAHGDYFDKDEETPLEYGLSDSKALTAELLQDRRVSSVLPRLAFSGLISNGEKSAIFVGSGIEPKGEFRINGALTKVEQGRLLKATAPSDVPEVMLAKGLARNLKAQPGDMLTLLATTSEGVLNAIDVRLAGIYSTGVPEMDARALMSDIGTAQELLVSDKVSSLAVYLYDLEGAPAFYRELKAKYTHLAFKRWDELAVFYTQVRNLYDRIFGMLGLIIVVMVFFAVANTVAMSVAERTREIGTLAALGTSARRLVANFAMEAGLIGVVSALAGMSLSAAVTLLLHIFPVMMPPPPGRTEGYPLYLYFDVGIYLSVALIIVAVSILAALLAARRGAGKPIVEALQHV